MLIKILLYNLCSYSIVIYLFVLQFSICQNKDKKYPLAKLLKSGEFLVINNEEINIYKSDFSLKETIYTFWGNEKLNGEEDYEKTILSDIMDKEYYYVFSLIKGKFLFIFNINNLPVKIYKLVYDSNNYSNFLPLRIENDFLFYIRVVLEEDAYFIFYLYKIDLIQISFQIISEKKYNYNNLKKYFSCNISKNQLICFYLLSEENDKYKLLAGIYDINLNFAKINSTQFDMKQEIKQIKSLSPDGKQFFVSFNDEQCKFNYLMYSIEENNFKNSNKEIKDCKTFDIYYFNETNQYIYIYIKKKNLIYLY